MSCGFNKYWIFFAVSILQIAAINVYGEALIGGYHTPGADVEPYAALVAPDGTANLLTGEILPEGVVTAVGLSSSKHGIIVGLDYSIFQGYAASVTPDGITSFLTGPALPVGMGYPRTAAINSSNLGIIGGSDNGFSDPYVALFSSSGVTSNITWNPGAAPIPDGGIYAVAINSSGNAIVGGMHDRTPPFPFHFPFVALVSSSGVGSSLTGTLPALKGIITGVDLNDSNIAIIVGAQNDWEDGYAAVVSPTGVATPITGHTAPLKGVVSGAAINSSGLAIIGGSGGMSDPPSGSDDGNIYAAMVSPSGVATAITGTPTPGRVYSTTINDSGLGIIGGKTNDNLYAAMVSPSGVATTITGLPVGTGEIRSVAIGQSGVGIIGGRFDSEAYVALISPSGVATPLTWGPGASLTGTGRISSVDIIDVDPPSFGSGESYADPVITLSTNVLETHLKRKRLPEREMEPAEEEELLGLTVYAGDIIKKPASNQNLPEYAVWVAPFGRYAHYKKLGDFSSSKDWIVGGIVGFDYLKQQGMILGTGIAYAYQDVNFSDNYGHAKTHQEFVTLYGAWYKELFSIQATLWGGLYQMENKRKTLRYISSKSDINGWIFCPHLEIGVPVRRTKFTFEPFVMADWVNNWQGCVKEKGRSGLNLRIGSHYVSLLRSEAGFNFIEFIEFKKGDLILEERVSYVNKAPFNAKKKQAYYVGSLSTFDIQMFSNRVENLGSIRLNGWFTPHNLKMPYIAMSYQGEFGSKQQSHFLMLEVGKRF